MTGSRLLQMIRTGLFRLGAAPLACLVLAGCGSAQAAGSAPVAWTNYPHLAAAPQDRAFLILKCTFSDDTTVPKGLDDRIATFLTLRGIGTGNMVDYYSDVSYGAISLAGDRVAGWYNAPFTRTSLGGANNRGERVKECANATPKDDIDFSRYYGIIMVSNVQNDGGACWSGQAGMDIHGTTYNVGCVVFDGNSLFTGFAAHEIGHALGFAHSWDDTKDRPCGNTTPGEYGDPYDMMSAMCTDMFAGANGYNPNNWANYDGPGLNAPNLLAQEWIPPVRIGTYMAGQGHATYVLNALSHPIGFGALTVKIVPDPATPDHFYTVEYRQRDGWDAGLRANTILVHEVRALPVLPALGVAPYSYLQMNGGDGHILQGGTWTDTTDMIQVTVTRIDTANGLATITVGYPSLFPTTPTVAIAAPANNAHVIAGSPFALTGRAVSGAGSALATADVTWTVDGSVIGHGDSIATHLLTGTHLVTLSARDPASGGSAQTSITLVADAPPTPTPAPSGTPQPAPLPARPTAVILSPTANADIMLNGSGNATIILSGQGSADVQQYHWTDSLGLIDDTSANDQVQIAPTYQQVGCWPVKDVITLTVTDSRGQTAQATVTVTIARECIR